MQINKQTVTLKATASKTKQKVASDIKANVVACPTMKTKASPYYLCLILTMFGWCVYCCSLICLLVCLFVCVFVYVKVQVEVEAEAEAEVWCRQLVCCLC